MTSPKREFTTVLEDTCLTTTLAYCSKDYILQQNVLYYTLKCIFMAKIKNKNILFWVPKSGANPIKNFLFLS